MRILMTLLSIVFFVSVIAQQPSRWRGKGGNGVYNETNLLKSWPETGPEVLWTYENLGEGHSSVAIANNKLYITNMQNDSLGMVTILSKDGKLINEYEYGIEFYESFPGSRSTAVVVGDKIYLYSGLGEVVCLNEKDGSTIWRKNILKEYGGDNVRWGVTETLVIDGNTLYCSPGGKNHNVVALNRLTGELIWSCPGKGGLSAYCTPLLVEMPSRKLLVTMMANNILGIDAATGKLLWSHEQTNRWSVHANTPLYHDGGLLCTSGYGKGSVKLTLSEDGSSVNKEWFVDSLDNRMGGIVYLDGYAYGSGDNQRGTFCLDWKTGDIKYFNKEVGKGNIITADGMLFMYTEKGELVMAKADPAGLDVSGTTKITLGSAQHWSHPVIDEGVLYLRHGTALMAFKLK